MLIKSTTSASRPVILRCRFTNNIAAEGAAVHVITYQNASPDFRNCTFDHNEATASGVVKIVIDGSQGPNVYFQNCLWHDNKSGGNGGAILCDEFAMLHLLNCTITRNTSTNGAAVAHLANTEGGPTRPFIVRVLNTIIWDNRSDDGQQNYSTALGAQLAGDADVEHSCVMNLFESGSVYAATAVASIDDDPSFENPSIDDFRLTCASPAINNASNTHVQSDQFDLNQNNSTSDSNPDLDDETRIVNVVDMGSYERPGPCCLGDINIDGAVNVTDLLAVIGAWGACPAAPATCPADITPSPCGDGQVNVSDLLAVIGTWGACASHCPGEGGMLGDIPQSYYDCQDMCSGMSGQDWVNCMQKCFDILCNQGQTEFCEN